MVSRALLPTHSSPAVTATCDRGAVLSFHLPVRTLSPQSSAVSPRIYLLAADHAGLCLDVSSRHACGGHQHTVASDRGRRRSRDGGGWLQTPPLEFVTGDPCYTDPIRSSERLLLSYRFYNIKSCYPE